MDGQDVSSALERARSVFERRPSAGLHDDATAVTRWDGGLRTVTRHPDGHEVTTDMPAEMGGGGAASPGWLWRSGLAACTATTIAIAADRVGVVLDLLEVEVSSRSDARGVLGMTEPDGVAVYPGSQDLQMRVRIGAHGATAEALRAIVAEGQRNAPLSTTLANAGPMALTVVVAGA